MTLLILVFVMLALMGTVCVISLGLFWLEDRIREQIGDE